VVAFCVGIGSVTAIFTVINGVLLRRTSGSSKREGSPQREKDKQTVKAIRKRARKAGAKNGGTSKAR
jgi:hypothetical protein